MKIEMIKETTPLPNGDDVCYVIHRDGRYVEGSYTKNELEAKNFFNFILKNGERKIIETINSIEL